MNKKLVYYSLLSLWDYEELENGRKEEEVLY